MSVSWLLSSLAIQLPPRQPNQFSRSCVMNNVTNTTYFYMYRQIQLSISNKNTNENEPKLHKILFKIAEIIAQFQDCYLTAVRYTKLRSCKLFGSIIVPFGKRQFLLPVAAVGHRGLTRSAVSFKHKLKLKMASSRDRETWAHIFKLYKGLPHLWDKNNMNYGNRNMMTNGYKILTRVYREHLDKQASVGALRMKMKNLRTTYYRELRKVRSVIFYLCKTMWFTIEIVFTDKNVSLLFFLIYR